MFNDTKRTFLFRCDECKMILSSEFEDESDIKDIQDDVLWLECPCGGKSKILRD